MLIMGGAEIARIERASGLLEEQLAELIKSIK